jgi:ADP-ribose pyrophosphatase YjhB (NUDIX family)
MSYKFCPKCGQRLVKKKLSDKIPRLVCSGCKFVFYQNSAPTASAIIVRGNKVLLGKRAIKPRKGYWDVPGGFLENGEHPLDGVKREIKEELGVEIEILKQLGIFMDKYNSWEFTLNIYYLAKIKKGRPKAASDIKEIRWFTADELPKKMAFKNNREALKAWLRK